MGALCAVCVPGSFYNSDEDACVPCDDYELTTQTIVGIVLIALIVLILLGLRLRRCVVTHHERIRADFDTILLSF